MAKPLEAIRDLHGVAQLKASDLWAMLAKRPPQFRGNVRYGVGGDATLDFQPEGLRATIAFPLEDALQSSN